MDLIELLFSSGDSPGDAPGPEGAASAPQGEEPQKKSPRDPRGPIDPLAPIFDAAGGTPIPTKGGGGVPFDYFTPLARESYDRGVEDVWTYGGGKNDMIEDILNAKDRNPPESNIEERLKKRRTIWHRIKGW